MSQANMTVAGTLWPASGVNSVLRAAILVAAGTLALAVAAKVQVPFWPVPVTLQSLVVLALGAAYGWRLAGVTLVAYLLEGAAGLPVFAGGSGLAYMMGPTGGYLVGFLAAAMLVGYLAEKGADKRSITMFGAMLAGAALIYVPGIASAPLNGCPNKKSAGASLKARFPRFLLVGVRGFEPPTPCSRSRCATRLRYTPSDRGAGYSGGVPLRASLKLRS